jgi:hypothetical protein
MRIDLIVELVPEGECCQLHVVSFIMEVFT